jgi:YebC/PmpR family DNA-binding regulatory protein
MGRAFEYRKASKEKRWDKMSKIFPKLSKAITVAAKEGGADPELNPKLRSAMLNARAENMPKDNVDAAIARASGKDATDISEIVYEAKVPFGVMLYIECATDNPNRSFMNVRTMISKGGGQTVPSGSLDFLFSRKSVFEFAAKSGVSIDDLELGLIDAGLEEIEENEGTVYVYGDYKDFGSLSKAFEDLKIDVTKASLQRIPSSPIDLTEEQMIEIEKLIDKLEDDEDVQAVYTNIA